MKSKCLYTFLVFKYFAEPFKEPFLLLNLVASMLTTLEKIKRTQIIIIQLSFSSVIINSLMCHFCFLNLVMNALTAALERVKVRHI